MAEASLEGLVVDLTWVVFRVVQFVAEPKKIQKSVNSLNLLIGREVEDRVAVSLRMNARLIAKSIRRNAGVLARRVAALVVMEVIVPSGNSNMPKTSHVCEIMIQ